MLNSSERREKILALLNEEKRVMVKNLAEKFQVSIDSIRRDLSIMEDQGLLKKTHGGAIPSIAKAGRIEDLDLLITDEDADPEATKQIQALGVKVIVAQLEGK